MAGSAALRSARMREQPPQGDAGWAVRIPGPPPPTAEASDPRVRELNALYARLDLPGPGWSELLDKLHANLVELDATYRLAQVKEKFGGLRFYADFEDSVRRQCQALVDEAERRSFHICERCGHPGTLRAERQRRLTLCDGCDLVL